MRTKGALNKATKQKEETKKAIPDEVVEEIDAQVLGMMGKTNRMRLTHVDEENLTLRQKQAAGSEFLACLVGHPAMRRRTIVAGLMDPLSLLKIASSEKPKELHVDGEMKQTVILLPGKLSDSEWQKEVDAIDVEAE